MNIFLMMKSEDFTLVWVVLQHSSYTIFLFFKQKKEKESKKTDNLFFSVGLFSSFIIHQRCFNKMTFYCKPQHRWINKWVYETTAQR